MSQILYHGFRILADVALVLSAPVLLAKIRTGHDGISLATQILHLLVFFTRYLDLFIGAHGLLYPSLVKALVLAGNVMATVSLIHSQCKHKWEGCVPGARVRRQVIWLNLPCVVLAIFFNYTVSPQLVSSINEYLERVNWIEIAWSFSIFLGAVADLPQLRELRHTEKKDPLIVTYCLLLFACRAFYIPRWYLRYISGDILDPISVAAGLVQTMLFLFYGIAIAVDAHRRRVGSAIRLP